MDDWLLRLPRLPACDNRLLMRSREQPLEGIVGQNRPAQHRQAHEGAVTAVVPTPDGLYCLTAGTDSRIRLWDLSDNR